MYHVIRTLARYAPAFVAAVVVACGSSPPEESRATSTGGTESKGTGTAGASSGALGSAAGTGGVLDSTAGGARNGGGESGTPDVSGGGVGGTGTSLDLGTGSTQSCGSIHASVVGVSATGTEDAYVFSVSVESADIDCSQYANWWEVLSEDGSLLFRRILEHPHTDENGTSDPDAPGNTFTREGGPVPIGADDVVIVRAHMSVGGYCGAVMAGSVAGGFTTALDLPSDFASEVVNEEPQPDECRL